MVTTVEILNKLRNDPSTGYRDVIPEVTRNNIALVGNALLEYVPNPNTFAATLLNKIGKTVIADKMLVNRFKALKRGEMPFGDTIEDIFVDMAQSEGWYDMRGLNPLGFRESGVHVLYHSVNYKGAFCKSVPDDEVRRAFLSQEGVSAFLGALINSLYAGDEDEEYIICKEMLAQYDGKYATYGVSEITDEASTADTLRAVRKAVIDVGFNSTNFNYAGVKTHTKPENLVLILNKDVMAHVDVDVLSKRFNMGKSDFEPEIILVDDFGSMPNTYGILADKEWFFMYDTSITTEPQRNADGEFTNHFLHHKGIFSLSHFRNAIRFRVYSPNIPVITTAAIEAGLAKDIEGTCKAGAVVNVYVNGVKAGAAVVAGDDWTYTITEVSAGDIITVKATVSDVEYTADKTIIVTGA